MLRTGFRLQLELAANIQEASIRTYKGSPPEQSRLQRSYKPLSNRGRGDTCIRPRGSLIVLGLGPLLLGYLCLSWFISEKCRLTSELTRRRDFIQASPDQ